jgi:hypothetical protein
LSRQAGESVLAIRTALAEQPLTAHLTAFDLILEPNKQPEQDQEEGAGTVAAATASTGESVRMFCVLFCFLAPFFCLNSNSQRP